MLSFAAGVIIPFEGREFLMAVAIAVAFLLSISAGKGKGKGRREGKKDPDTASVIPADIPGMDSFERMSLLGLFSGAMLSSWVFTWSWSHMGMPWGICLVFCTYCFYIASILQG